jgi:aquaporin Z
MRVRKYVVEFIGAFFLVFTIGMVALEPNSQPKGFQPIAIGAILMVMIYAGGHISGGHYNPAVTLAAAIRGRCPWGDVPFYMIAQFAAAIAAVIVVPVAKGTPVVGSSTIDIVPTLLAEFLFTFALAYVVLNVATSKNNAGNSNYGLAIGFTVLAGAYAVGSISGGAFNPAVAVAIVAWGMIPTKTIWIYLVANFLGGALAGFAFNNLNREDR